MPIAFLDMRTIIFMMMMNSLICTLILTSLWSRSRSRYKGTFYWVLDYIFQTIALLLIGLRGTIPDGLSMVVSNLMVLTGTLFCYRGLEAFTNKRSSQIHNVIFLLIFTLVHCYFTFFKPSLVIRNLNLSIAFLLITLQCFHLLLFRVKRSLIPVTRGVGIIFGFFCLLHIARIGHEIFQGQISQDFFKSGVFDSLLIISFQLILIILAYSLVLMVNKRLLRDMGQQEEIFSKAFQASPYGMVLTRLSDGSILEVNEGFEKITGYHAKEIQGKTTLELHIWENENDRIRILEELLTRGEIHDIEVTFRRRSGERFTGVLTSDVIIINNEKTILSTVNDISRRKQAEEERERLVSELKEALSQIKTLSGLLPICASCKKIRNEKGSWEQVELYIRDRSNADFSHGICPECQKRLYPDLVQPP